MPVGHRYYYPDGIAQRGRNVGGVTIDGPTNVELGKPFGFPSQKLDLPAEPPGCHLQRPARHRQRQDRDPNVVMN